MRILKQKNANKQLDHVLYAHLPFDLGPAHNMTAKCKADENAIYIVATGQLPLS